MGQCYSVYLKIKLKDTDKFLQLSQVYAIENKWSTDNINKMISVDRIIKCFVGAGPDLRIAYEDGWPVFRGDYDASYSWEGTLEEWFKAVAPSLEDGSEIEVYPDDGEWRYVVTGGVAK